MSQSSVDEIVDDVLEHFGVKGMKWGIRKEEISGASKSGVSVDTKLHESTRNAALAMAPLINERYGFSIKHVRSMGPGDPDYDAGALGYVELGGKSSKEGTIVASIKDSRPLMEKSEKAGWVGPGCGTPKAFLTHETAHAIFHAPQEIKNGKIVGGYVEERTTALKAAIEESKRMGVAENNLLSSVSGYANKSGTRHELEAEMFSQYHWGTNPPNFVIVWGQVLHKEMGIDATPFKERR